MLRRFSAANWTTRVKFTPRSAWTSVFPFRNSWRLPRVSSDVGTNREAVFAGLSAIIPPDLSSYSSAIRDNASNQQIKHSLLYYFTKCTSNNFQQMVFVMSGSKGGDRSFPILNLGSVQVQGDLRTNLQYQTKRQLKWFILSLFFFDSKHISWMSPLFPLWNKLTGQRSGVSGLQPWQ